MRGGFYDLNILVDRDSFSISEVTSTLKMAYECEYLGYTLCTVVLIE